MQYLQGNSAAGLNRATTLVFASKPKLVVSVTRRRERSLQLYAQKNKGFYFEYEDVEDGDKFVPEAPPADEFSWVKKARSDSVKFEELDENSSKKSRKKRQKQRKHAPMPGAQAEAKQPSQVVSKPPVVTTYLSESLQRPQFRPIERTNQPEPAALPEDTASSNDKAALADAAAAQRQEAERVMVARRRKLVERMKLAPNEEVQSAGTSASRVVQPLPDSVSHTEAVKSAQPLASSPSLHSSTAVAATIGTAASTFTIGTEDAAITSPTLPTLPEVTVTPLQEATAGDPSASLFPRIMQRLQDEQGHVSAEEMAAIDLIQQWMRGDDDDDDDDDDEEEQGDPASRVSRDKQRQQQWEQYLEQIRAAGAQQGGAAAPKIAASSGGDGDDAEGDSPDSMIMTQLQALASGGLDPAALKMPDESILDELIAKATKDIDSLQALMATLGAPASMLDDGVEAEEESDEQLESKVLLQLKSQDPAMYRLLVGSDPELDGFDAELDAFMAEAAAVVRERADAGSLEGDDSANADVLDEEVDEDETYLNNIEELAGEENEHDMEDFMDALDDDPDMTEQEKMKIRMSMQGMYNLSSREIPELPAKRVGVELSPTAISTAGQLPKDVEVQLKPRPIRKIS